MGARSVLGKANECSAIRLSEPQNHSIASARERNFFKRNQSLSRIRSLHCTVLLLAGLVLLTNLGCSTHRDRLVKARDHFYAGRLADADKEIEETLSKKKRGGEHDVLLLDQAIVELSKGEPEDAERILLDVRDHFDAKETPIVGQRALSYLTDDTKRAYSGEDYERILIRVFLALSNLMSDGSDVIPYSLQVQDEQAKVAQKVEEKFAKRRKRAEDKGEATEETQEPFVVHQHLAIAPYLQGMFAEATHNRYDEAVRSYSKVVSWQPTFVPGPQDLDRAQNGRHSQQGNGVVYVFAMVGRGPYKEEGLEVPTSQALLIADQILSATGKYSLPPTIAPIKVPRVVAAPNEIDRVNVRLAQGSELGRTSVITDVTKLALAQNKAEMPEIVGRAVARRVIKKAIIYTTKDTTSSGKGSLMSLALDAAGVIWEASEAADTRCWGLLPDTIQVLRVELPVGTHELQLVPASGSGPKGPPVKRVVEVRDGGNTYALVNFPTGQPAGEVLTSSY